jgi:CheY-like chemotaxis protein
MTYTDARPRILAPKEGCSAVRILVADDHETIRKGVRSILSARKSMEVCEAATGKEAVDKARETKPDLLILDINMPIMGGLEAAREIRTLPNVPILFSLCTRAFASFRRLSLSAPKAS